MTNSRSLLLTLLLLAFSQTATYAQRTLGVKWNAPKNTDSAVTQLHKIAEAGISALEIQSDLPPETWQKIDSLQFKVYGSFGIKYPLKSTFGEPDSALISAIQNKASAYLSQPSVTAVGLFEFGAIHKSAFLESLKPITDQLKRSTQKSLYYTSRRLTSENRLTDFVLLDIRITPADLDYLSLPNSSNIGGYIYSPSPDLKGYLSPFKKFLNKTSAYPDKTVFVHSNWLLNMLDKYPRFSKTLHSISNDTNAVFPLPRENLPGQTPPVLPIFVLLVVWGTIAWHYNTSPLYRKALFRYFIAHKFFVDDIFKRQIRSVAPAFTIILQNALLISASGFATFTVLFSPLGQAAFFHHFPSLALLTNTGYSIFIWIFLAALLIPLVNVIWLFTTHRKVSSFTQITTLYAWPLQVNFLLCTIAITLYAADSGSQIIAILTAAAFLFLFLSFIFTSVDTFRFARARFFHLIKTSIPYLLVLGGLVIWIILTKEEWLEIFSLSLNLK